MARVFSIVELIRGDAGLLSEGVRFEWDSSHQSSPRTSWTWEKSMRNVRTDYDGSDVPTQQMLGPKFEDFAITGKWDDRYNPLPESSDGTGFAQATLEAMEDLVGRANLCAFQLDKNLLYGVITKCKITYRRSAEIGYELTVSPHYRNQRGQSRKPPAIRSASAEQMLDEMNNRHIELAAAHLRAPDDGAMPGDVIDQVGSRLDDIADALQTMGDVVQTRILGPAGQAVDGFARAAQGMAAVMSVSLNTAQGIRGLRADTVLAYQTAMTVLNFECWRRTLACNSMIASLRAAENGNELARRARPAVKRVYRPHKGESPMAISTKFYGTPHKWREIFRRNDITTTQLQGTELLIIPESI